MRSTALPAYQYGDPCRVLEQKQAAEANARKRAEETGRPILHCKPGWSRYRQAAEALFAPESDLTFPPGTASNSPQAGNGKDSL